MCWGVWGRGVSTFCVRVGGIVMFLVVEYKCCNCFVVAENVCFWKSGFVNIIMCVVFL